MPKTKTNEKCGKSITVDGYTAACAEPVGHPGSHVSPGNVTVTWSVVVHGDDTAERADRVRAAAKSGGVKAGQDAFMNEVADILKF